VGVSKVRSIKELLDITSKRERNRGTLWASIQDRRIVRFYYRGGYRNVEPYALGITRHGKADNESLICYQISGFCNLGEPVGWKLYRVVEMKDIEVSHERFNGDRPGYDPDNIKMAQVFCCCQPVTPAGEREENTGATDAKPPPVYLAPRPLKSLTHNERMRRFRITHRLTGPKEYKSGPGPAIKAPPQRTKSKT
jgi:hypothetical protein